jgi:hypothetical protein
MKFSLKKKYIKTDGWRGYEQPVYAIAGASDTGMWSDSPCPSNEVNKEINEARKLLKQKGFSTKLTSGGTSNVFAGKRWIVAPVNMQKEAKAVIEDAINKNRKWRYLHGAD